MGKRLVGFLGLAGMELLPVAVRHPLDLFAF